MITIFVIMILLEELIIHLGSADIKSAFNIAHY